MEIFQYDFMVRAFAAGIGIAVVAPIIGTFLVVRRYSMIADTLAHASLPGVALGSFIKINPIVAALFFSGLLALGIEKIRTTKRVFSDAILALFMSGSLALAVVLASLNKGFNANFFNYLFGSITTVNVADLYLICGLDAAVLLTIYYFYRELFLISLDEKIAKASGIKVEFLNYLTMVLAAMVIATGIITVGALLIGALMIIPVLTALQTKKGFQKTIFLATAISLFSVISGIFLAYYLNLATGGTVVLVNIFIFFLVFLFRK